MPKRQSTLTRQSKGFTLIEILVVVVLIVIVSAVFFFNTSIVGVERHLTNEANRIQALLYLAGEEAILYGREYGFEILEEGYQFSRLNEDSQQWEIPEDTRSLRPRQLPDGMRLELFLEDTDVLLEVERDEKNKELPNPQIFVLSSGELTPFALRLDSEFVDGFIEIRGFADGAIESEWTTIEY